MLCKGGAVLFPQIEMNKLLKNKRLLSHIINFIIDDYKGLLETCRIPEIDWIEHKAQYENELQRYPEARTGKLARTGDTADWRKKIRRMTHQNKTQHQFDRLFFNAMLGTTSMLWAAKRGADFIYRITIRTGNMVVDPNSIVVPGFTGEDVVWVPEEKRVVRNNLVRFFSDECLPDLIKIARILMSRSDKYLFKTANSILLDDSLSFTDFKRRAYVFLMDACRCKTSLKFQLAKILFENINPITSRLNNFGNCPEWEPTLRKFREMCKT